MLSEDRKVLWALASPVAGPDRPVFREADSRDWRNADSASEQLPLPGTLHLISIKDTNHSEVCDVMLRFPDFERKS